MRKIKEVLRLHSLGLQQRAIARACSISQSTVSEYMKASTVAGLAWNDIADWDEARLVAALTPAAKTPPRRNQKPEPDFAAIQAELQQLKHLTLQLVWEEYTAAHPEGYRYSRFCELYQRWRSKLEVVLRQDHRAGEKLFVDYAGSTIAVTNPHDGEIKPAQVFVGVLGASSYAFAEATWTQGLADWIGSHIRAFEFFGAVPEIVVPDNLKSAVTKPCRYEPGINVTYEEMARHYGVAVIPARARKPRDKAKVEVGVQVVQRWILAALRKRTFFSLSEANEAIDELLAKLNERRFRKREGSRRSLFESLDRPAMKPLPAERYQYGEWKTARVNIDYHVEFDRHWYSVPHQLTHQQVEIHATATAIEILHKGVRVASHVRSRATHKHTTVASHMPKAHQRHVEWTPSRVIEWAAKIGPATAQVVERILAAKRHPEHGFRAGLGIIRLGEKYTHARVEAAARRALASGTCSYPSLQSILENNLDSQLPEPASSAAPPADHPNLRGPGYYDTTE
jgi:transposase